MNKFKLFINHLYSFISLFKWLIIQIKNEDFINYIKYNKLNENIIILGSGPSLTDDLLKIKHISNSKFLAVNDFINSALFNELKPHYYVLADPGYFDKNCDNILVQGTIKLLHNIDYNLELYIPFVYKDIFLKNNPHIIKNKFLIIKPFHTNEYCGFEKVNHFLYEFGLSMPLAQNILIAAIFISINLGYKSVYLLGADHSWLYDLRVNEFNQVCQFKRHFYKSNENNQLTLFLKSPNETFKMHEILLILSRTFHGYHKLEKYSKKRNTKVINVTTNSYIDAFERF